MSSDLNIFDMSVEQAVLNEKLRIKNETIIFPRKDKADNCTTRSKKELPVNCEISSTNQISEDKFEKSKKKLTKYDSHTRNSLLSVSGGRLRFRKETETPRVPNFESKITDSSLTEKEGNKKCLYSDPHLVKNKMHVPKEILSIKVNDENKIDISNICHENELMDPLPISKSDKHKTYSSTYIEEGLESFKRDIELSKPGTCDVYEESEASDYLIKTTNFRIVSNEEKLGKRNKKKISTPLRTKIQEQQTNYGGYANSNDFYFDDDVKVAKQLSDIEQQKNKAISVKKLPDSEDISSLDNVQSINPSYFYDNLMEAGHISITVDENSEKDKPNSNIEMNSIILNNISPTIRRQTIIFPDNDISVEGGLNTTDTVTEIKEIENEKLPIESPTHMDMRSIKEKSAVEMELDNSLVLTGIGNKNMSVDNESIVFTPTQSEGDNLTLNKFAYIESTPHRSFLEFERLERKTIMEQKLFDEKKKRSIRGFEVSEDTEPINTIYKDQHELESCDTSRNIHIIGKKRFNQNISSNFPTPKRKYTSPVKQINTKNKHVFKKPVKTYENKKDENIFSSMVSSKSFNSPEDVILTSSDEDGGSFHNLTSSLELEGSSKNCQKNKKDQVITSENDDEIKTSINNQISQESSLEELYCDSSTGNVEEFKKNYVNLTYDHSLLPYKNNMKMGNQNRTQTNLGTNVLFAEENWGTPDNEKNGKCSFLCSNNSTESCNCKKLSALLVPKPLPLCPVIDDRLKKCCQLPGLKHVNEFYRRTSLQKVIDITHYRTHADYKYLETDISEISDSNHVESIIEQFQSFFPRFEKKICSTLSVPSANDAFIRNLAVFLSEKTPNWVANYEMEYIGRIFFNFKKIKTFNVICDYEKENIFGNCIHVNRMEIRRSRIPKKNLKSIDQLIYFQLKLHLPISFKTLCGKSCQEDIIKELLRIEEVCEKVLKFCHELWCVICNFNATLLNDGDQVCIKKSVRSISKNEIRTTSSIFQIEVKNVEKLSFKDIIYPPIHSFKETVQYLPTGIAFLQEFLKDPMKFLQLQDSRE